MMSALLVNTNPLTTNDDECTHFIHVLWSYVTSWHNSIYSTVDDSSTREVFSIFESNRRGLFWPILTSLFELQAHLFIASSSVVQALGNPSNLARVIHRVWNSRATPSRVSTWRRRGRRRRRRRRRRKRRGWERGRGRGRGKGKGGRM